jgi:hypothetical protein
MNLLIDRCGRIRCVYDEAIDVSLLGSVTIRRASRVEPDESGCWWAELSPVCGPLLGPFAQKSAALAAESAWLDAHWLLLTGGIGDSANKSLSIPA